MSYENTTTLELMAEVLGHDPMGVSVAQAALCDNLLRAHQDQVTRLEEELRDQVRRVLCPPVRVERRGLVIQAAKRFAQGKSHARKPGA